MRQCPPALGMILETPTIFPLSMTSNYELNQTAMDNYSLPHWSGSYAMYFFWGFACSTGALLYSFLWYGKSSYLIITESWHGRRDDYGDPYLKLMDRLPRVPHWWYGALLAVCVALSLGCLYGGNMELPWWGFFVICIVSAICTFPNGILWGVANFQVGMAFLSEIMAGAMFPGKANCRSCMYDLRPTDSRAES